MLRRRLSTDEGREKQDALLLKQLGRLGYTNRGAFLATNSDK
jgi:hypothetical protein